MYCRCRMGPLAIGTRLSQGTFRTNWLSTITVLMRISKFLTSKTSLWMGTIRAKYKSRKSNFNFGRRKPNTEKKYESGVGQSRRPLMIRELMNIDDRHLSPLQIDQNVISRIQSIFRGIHCPSSWNVSVIKCEDNMEATPSEIKMQALSFDFCRRHV